MQVLWRLIQAHLKGKSANTYFDFMRVGPIRGLAVDQTRLGACQQGQRSHIMKGNGWVVVAKVGESVAAKRTDSCGDMEQLELMELILVSEHNSKEAADQACAARGAGKCGLAHIDFVPASSALAIFCSAAVCQFGEPLRSCPRVERSSICFMTRRFRANGLRQHYCW